LILGGYSVAGLAGWWSGGCATAKPGGTTDTGAGEPASYPFPFLEVSGTPFECGKALGSRFASQIRTGLERRAGWFGELLQFMKADLAARYEPFLAAAKTHFPDVVEELRGWAQGSQVGFMELMALNLRAELGSMMLETGETPGCSTLVLSKGDRRLLAHNEDGHRAYADLMYLAKVRQEGKPAFMSLCYPGILPGNGPAITEAGLVLTTNYIASREWRPGVGRYFLDRAMLGARRLDEAVAIACHPERAFAFHYNLGSIPERRLVSLETSVSRHAAREITGLYLHTNHFVLPDMTDVPQDESYVSTSSMSRYRVLSAKQRQLETSPDGAVAGQLTTALASHESAPYSPCRHPTHDVSGTTLASSVFDLAQGTWALNPGNPCQGQATVLKPF